jgi:hypothetical protein
MYIIQKLLMDLISGNLNNHLDSIGRTAFEVLHVDLVTLSGKLTRCHVYECGYTGVSIATLIEHVITRK